MSIKNGRRPERTPSFQFYALDFIADRAVVAMSPLERGGYVMLLCHAWISDRPGWLPDDDHLLGALSGLGGHWPDCRVGIARAFSIRKGWWIQKRMVRERRAQLSHFRERSRSGRAGAKAKWQRNIDARAMRLPMAKHGASASASASVLKKKKKSARAEAIREITAEQIRSAAERFKLPLETAQLLADKIRLEFDTRGYSNAPSALLSWCQREAKNPSPNGHEPSDPYGEAMFTAGDGDD